MTKPSISIDVLMHQCHHVIIPLLFTLAGKATELVFPNHSLSFAVPIKFCVKIWSVRLDGDGHPLIVLPVRSVASTVIIFCLVISFCERLHVWLRMSEKTRAFPEDFLCSCLLVFPNSFDWKVVSRCAFETSLFLIGDFFFSWKKKLARDSEE